jgi:DNA mismatch repair ATPase MutS
MKAFLMYKNQDFDPKTPFPVNAQDLTNDLELNTLFNAMAQDDDFLFDVIKKSILCGTGDLETILYRQDILKDCVKNASVIREIYHIPIESFENKRKRWLGIFTRYPSAVLDGSVELMKMFVELLKHLKKIADEHAGDFASEGFTRFFAMIQKELDDEYFTIVENHLKELKFQDGVMLSAKLGKGNEGENYILRLPNRRKRNLVKDFFAHRNPLYSFAISDRDDAGARALSELKDRGINLVANALAQSADHIDNFLDMLRLELAFYVGCINLYEQLNQMGSPITFPAPVPSDERRHSFHGLYDVCLALTMKQKIVGNDVNADGKDLVIITGANQGGKSTFLRSIGLAQLMMQAGMFVPSEDFTANLCSGIFTHYKRKEDATMKSGKLDEELKRMSGIVDLISPNSLMLFNESFAATNEREGSEIARQITTALLEKRIKVFFVTHMYTFAHAFYLKKKHDGVFLRAERKAGGKRTFRLIEGEPLQTSFGEDVYHTVFGVNN